jgi:hypothetical protein
MVRSLAMPSRFGSVAKVYVVQDDHLNDISEKNSDTPGADSSDSQDETQGGTDQKTTYGG